MSAELTDILNRIHLQDYLPNLVENGFDSWDVVCDITEEDLAHLGFKLGHRRTLQREIAVSRGSLHGRPLGSNTTSQSPRTMASPEKPNGSHSPTPPRAEERTKRRYRRKPRPDINAPKKPKTAYVNFADALRTDPAISSLSFVDIAREVGRRWQALPPEQKHSWECQAARDMQEYEAQMDEYKTTENYRRYQNYLKSFHQDQSQGKKQRCGPRPVLDQERKSRSNSSETLSIGSDDIISRSNSGSRFSDECQVAVDLAVQELSIRKDEVLAQGAPIFDAHNLPQEGMIRDAASSCRLGTGSLLFLIREELLEEMLDHVYSRDRIDPLSLIVVFLVAAIGAHYDTECMSDITRHGLFASATIIFESEFTGLTDFRVMWVFALHSLHSLLEKHMVARHVVTAGLQISRTRSELLDKLESMPLKPEDVKRLICTLVFMECWLSTTLGYKADVRAEDITRAYSLHKASSHVADAIYYQACKIGLVSREIADITVHKAPNAVRTEHIELLTEKLDGWYKSLPANMHLAALTDEIQSACLTYYQRRAILMVHMFYLGGIISLYRQLLLQACEARIQSKWHLEMPYSQIQNYRTRCSIAAQQMARMMPLISFSGAMTRRCWVIIYWAFHSCTVILFNIAQHMLDQRPTTIEEDFAYAKVCVDTLCACSVAEPVAAKHLGLIQPLYDALVDKHKRSQHQALSTVDTPLRQGTHTSSTYPPPIDSVQIDSQQSSPVNAHPTHQPRPETLDSEIVSIVKKLSGLLAEPFSLGIKAKIQGVRETSNAVGTYSVLWWK